VLYFSLHQQFFHKKSRLYQPSLNNNAESPNGNHSHSKKSLWTRFIILSASQWHKLSVISAQSQIHYSSNEKLLQQSYTSGSKI